MMASMKQVGIMYQGLAVLGAGSILSGVILASVTTYIIERNFSKASAFAAAGALLTSFGLMHGEEVDVSRIQNPALVAAYLLVAGVLFACHRLAVVAAPPVATEEHGESDVSDEHEKGELATAE
jgi:AGZA family xanthine/uracil permease-like MFS transporter